MNPILIFSLFIVPVFKDIFSGAGKLFQSKEAKAILVLIGGYFLYDYFKKETKKKDYLSGNNIAGNLAIRMKAALHPYLDFKIPFLGYLDDGTDEDAVKAIAQEAKTYNIVNEVFDAYKYLFDLDLAKELVDEGVDKIFYAAAGTLASGTNSTQVPNTTKYIYTNLTYSVRKGFKLRDFVTGNKTRLTTEDEKFRVLEIHKNLTLGTGVDRNTDTYCRVRIPGQFIIVDYWLALSAIKPN